VIPLTRRLPASPEAVWDVLIDTEAWPEWGPSVRSVEVSAGTRRIAAGSTGRVGTALGVWLPFEITEWDEGRHWAWKVAGVPATAHGVAPDDGRPGGSRATMDVPNWAPAYLPVCWVALARIGRLAARS
jgi:uncharacterized protein YndB with AHSA1/START domain